MTSRSAILLAFAIAIATGSRVEAQPVAPTALGPSDGASVEVPFTISWSATLSASDINGGYNWQVSRSSTFAPLVLADSTNPATTEDTISGLIPGTYFWRVQAANGAGQSAWSQPRSFTVTGAGPGTPGTPVLAPTRGYSTLHPWEAVHFDWSAVANAVTYRLEISNDPDFPVGALPPGIVTFWNDNIPANRDGYIHTMVGTWYARVFAVSADNPQEGIRSLPSNVIQFTCFYNNPIGPPPQLLAPVDNPTVTLPVALTWAHVPNPQPSGYVLEVARDPGFADIEFFYNQYTEPTVEMLSLTSGQKFWRVLSQHGLSSPTTNAVTDWSATGRFTISSAPATPVSFAVSGTPGMVVYSGAERRLALQLTAAVPPQGATVALSSSHPALAPVPATLSMPGSHAWAELPIRFGQVTTATVMTFTATLNGVSTSSQVTVRPPTLNDEIFQAAPVRATGGATMTGWVDLEGGGLAGAGGFIVSLSSSSPSASVPSTVTIPAGVSGTAFSIQTSAVTTTTVVTITASAGGVSTAWAITLTTAPAPGDLIVRPMSTTSGSQGIVTVNEGLGQDQLVQVTSSNPAVASVPNTATVFAGSGIGFFDITTVPVTEPSEVTISVSGGGVTLSHPLVLHPTLPALGPLTVNPASVVGGDSAIGTVTLASPAPPPGVFVNIGSNQPLSASAPRSVFVPAGSTSATFAITTFPGFTTTVQLTAALNDAFQFSTITVNQAAATPALSAVSLNQTSVSGGTSVTGTVTLSAPAGDGGAVVALSDNSSATAVPASVTVVAGSSSANFPVTTNTVSTSTSVTITASFGGTSRTVTLVVEPAIAPAPSAPSLVSPANGAIVAQPITFDWSNVNGASTYLIQIDDSDRFTTPLTFTQNVSGSQSTVTGLPAQRLFWRVRAVNAAGTAGPFSTIRRFTAQTAPSAPALSSIGLSPTSVVGENTATGTLTLSSAASGGGLVVALSTSNAAVASVPASVTVAAGATTATFAISTTAVSASTSVTITGTGGGATRTATLTVTPVPPPASLSAIGLSPASVTGGASSTGTVTLTGAAPAGGLVINLSSSNPAVASVPPNLTSSAGATSAQFQVTTTAVTTSTSVTISGTDGGGTARSATLTINPASSGALPAPSLLSPANDARFSPGQTIVFDWSDVSGASTYTIQIDDGETFSTPLTVSQTVAASQFTTSLLPATRFWWRVRANDASGTPGAWSAVRRMEVRD